MRKKLRWGGLALAVVALGAGYWTWRKLRRQVDKTVTQPYVKPDLTVDEIRDKLKTGDFKQRIEATQQLNKLEPEERLRVLLKLAEAPESPVRMLAVKELRKIDAPEAKQKLQDLAANDLDSDVRELAAP